MSHHDKELENKINTEAQASADLDAENHLRQSRRRLLTMLGVGLAGAYVAPTLFSLGQAQAGDWRNSYSRPSYSRPSYSHPSYSGPNDYEYRPRERVSEYSDNPISILEDVLFGTQKPY